MLRGIVSSGKENEPMQERHSCVCDDERQQQFVREEAWLELIALLEISCEG